MGDGQPPERVEPWVSLVGMGNIKHPDPDPEYVICEFETLAQQQTDMETLDLDVQSRAEGRRDAQMERVRLPAPYPVDALPEGLEPDVVKATTVAASVDAEACGNESVGIQ